MHQSRQKKTHPTETELLAMLSSRHHFRLSIDNGFRFPESKIEPKEEKNHQKQIHLLADSLHHSSSKARNEDGNERLFSFLLKEIKISDEKTSEIRVIQKKIFYEENKF
ncbi:hypothetical protein TNCT_659481 [Trichonephila clavata]|uniref:Uncharacterized protein n=1 Tax=Trichonephila clavata TaxID=2740835 RepID=A0A8X6FUN2_TRICU|nr:hypothetical protein TNCT_659481 [Trichonephila clavata]